MKNTLLTLFLLAFSCSFIKAQVSEIPWDTSYTIASSYAKIKKQYPFAVPVRDSLPAGVIADRDVVYTVLENTAFGKRELHVDVFRPAKPGIYPVVMMIHGGGWRSGNKSMQVPMSEMLASHGFVAVAVEYQLSLEAKYPAAVYNIKSAIRWIRKNASKYHADPQRIAISGCSAGGQLAALVGMTNGVEKFEGNQGNEGYSSDIKAIIDIDGVLDFMAPSSLNLERKPNSADVSWLGGTFYEKPETWKEASSIFWVNEHSVPVLFVISGLSRFHAGQDEMIGMLKERNIYTEVRKFNVQVHPFWLCHPWVDELVPTMADFLKKVL